MSSLPVGILNTLGEVIVGWFGDRSWVSTPCLYALCMLCCGVTSALIPLCRSYPLVLGEYQPFKLLCGHDLDSMLITSSITLLWKTTDAQFAIYVQYLHILVLYIHVLVYFCIQYNTKRNVLFSVLYCIMYRLLYIVLGYA